jgi:hypothetical protein
MGGVEEAVELQPELDVTSVQREPASARGSNGSVWWWGRSSTGPSDRCDIHATSESSGC